MLVRSWNCAQEGSIAEHLGGCGWLAASGVEVVTIAKNAELSCWCLAFVPRLPSAGKAGLGEGGHMGVHSFAGASRASSQTINMVFHELILVMC